MKHESDERVSITYHLHGSLKSILFLVDFDIANDGTVVCIVKDISHSLVKEILSTVRLSIVSEHGLSVPPAQAEITWQASASGRKYEYSECNECGMLAA